MLSWFRRRKPQTPPAAPPPPAPPEDEDAEAPPPDFGTHIRVAFASDRRSWEEDFDLLRVAADVLRQFGHTVTTDAPDALRVAPAGLTLRPVLRHFQPLDDGAGTTSVTTIHADHPDFGGQEVFEYQHASGETLEAAIRSGFEQWAQVDLPVLLDALAAQPANCALMEMAFPDAPDGTPGLARRAVLGPIAHFARNPASQPSDGDGGHSFCPCCFLTQNIDAFKPLVESTGFHAIRFYAARGDDGEPQADCRVNGEDHADGAAALRRYVTTWPDAGLEFRKQYVILQNAPPPAPAAERYTGDA
jgi:hypothetical protein